MNRLLGGASVISITVVWLIVSSYSATAQDEPGYSRPDYADDRNVALGCEAFDTMGNLVIETTDGDFVTNWNEMAEHCSLTIKLKEETWIEGIWWTREYQPDGTIWNRA